MSLFQDDFYSTKTSSWRPNRSGRNPWGRNQWVGLVVLSGVAGILLALFVIPLFGGGGQSGRSGDWDSRVVAATEKVRPTVVSVISLMKEPVKGERQGIGLGSGVMFQKVGGIVRIATNNHVVEGGVAFEVILANKERRKAVLVGRDTLTDLAVLEIDASGLTSMAGFGNSDNLKSGQTAIAIGNPLGLDFSQTTTLGIISSPKRTIPVSVGPYGETEWEMNVIQTDAAINQGNSGGPLINIDGQVIGINSLKIAGSGVEGLGFAIPINDAKPILDLLIKDHRVKRPFMGISMDDLQAYKVIDSLKLPASVREGVIVIDVPGGPAKEAGLRTSDVIVEMDGKPVGNSIALRKFLFNEKKIGDKLTLSYYRGGKKANVILVLAELPER